jgi:ATP-dependent helicase HrpB
MQHQGTRPASKDSSGDSLSKLPIFEVLPEVIKALATAPIVILQAPPGAGKSTALPLEILSLPWLGQQQIALLQPRRIAAKMVAERLAAGLDETVGETVGYTVRFEQKTSKATRLEVMTEGILLRRLQKDSELAGIGLIIIDEFHERSLNADLALALCREVQDVLRPDLRILIMSATLGLEDLTTALPNAPVIVSAGRQFNLDIRYLETGSGTVDQRSIVAETTQLIRKALASTIGDVLVFLPGQSEIRQVQTMLESKDASGLSGPLVVLPLYADLPAPEQQKALVPHPNGIRKVILATSIAETSLTIAGIRTVVDSGWARQPRYDAKSGFSRLETVRVTVGAATQRAGRAARQGDGVAFRLWTKAQQTQLLPSRQPEVLTTDLASLVLENACWGHATPTGLPWITVPPIGSWVSAQQLLTNLGALQDTKPTILGKQLGAYPTHPRIATLLALGATTPNLAPLAADVAAVLEERDPLMQADSIDLSLRVEALRKYRRREPVNAHRNVLDRLVRLSDQWLRILKTGSSNNPPNPYQVGLLIAAAYPDRIAQQRNPNQPTYKLINGRMAALPDHDPLSTDPWIAIADLDAGTAQGRIYGAAPLDINTLQHLWTQSNVVGWNQSTNRLTAETQTKIGELVIKTSNLATPPHAESRPIVLQAIRDQRWRLLPKPEGLEQWQARIMSLKQWEPTLTAEWPSIDDDTLFNSIDLWLSHAVDQVRKAEDLNKIDPFSYIQQLLTWDQQQTLNANAPAYIEVPSGSDIKLLYHNDGDKPVLAVRLQELFGLLDTPTVNQGKVGVLIHLLSPGFKPVQVTQDLRSFWTNTYQEVKKELKRRYPKHSWPDDPFTAIAVRGPVKRRPIT